MEGKVKRKLSKKLEQKWIKEEVLKQEYQGYEEFLDDIAYASKLSLQHNRETNIPYGKHHLHLTPLPTSNNITVKVFDLSLEEFNQLIDLLNSFINN